MAEGKDRFVKKLDLTSSNLATSWRTFKAQFEVVKIAKKFGDMSEEEQIANVLLLMGSDCLPIYSQFTFSDTVEDQKKKLVNVIAMFDRHFEPVKNTIFERVKFNEMKQGDMSIHQFITELQSQADNCEYGQMKDQLIRDRIVVGVSDKKLRDYLIDVEELDLAKCITKAKQYVSNHSQAKRLESTVADNLDYCEPSYDNNREIDFVRPSYRGGRGGKRQPSSHSSGRCQYCSRGSHPRDRCPARKAVCYACKEEGHWIRSKACAGKKQKSSSANTVELCEEMGGLFLDSTDSD